MSVSVIVLNFNDTSQEIKCKVREFLLDYVIQHEPVYSKLDIGVPGEIELYVFDIHAEADRFLRAVEVLRGSDPMAANKIQCMPVMEPEGRHVVTYDHVNGLTVLVKPGDAIESLVHRYEHGRKINGAWFSPGSIDKHTNIGRYLGEITRVLFTGPSGEVKKVRATLRYEMLRPRSKHASQHNWFEDNLEKAVGKLSEHGRIYIANTRGDLFTFTRNNVEVNKLDDLPTVIGALANKWQVAKTYFTEEVTQVVPHNLNPFQQRVRGAAHLAILGRNEAGFV